MTKTFYIVSGGFDPIHEGHIDMINASSAESDGVIIFVNSTDWLIRKKGREYIPMKTRMAVCGALRGVVDCLAFDDSDNSACDGMRLAREKYPDANLVFANGGDRTRDNIPEVSVCKKYNVKLKFGVGGENKANSSQWITKNWDSKK